MKNHTDFQSLLAQYAAGCLSTEEKTSIEQHLSKCAECRAELAFWREISRAVEDEYEQKSAPTISLQSTFDQIHRNGQKTSSFRRIWQILKFQVPLIRGEIWSASLLVLLLGFAITLVADKAAVFYAIAPVVSAAGLVLIYGGRQDPAHEMVQATPISQVEILLSRSLLVFSYNLILTLILSIGLAAIYTMGMIGVLILDWLAPMAFLSALGLGLSIFLNSENALMITYLLWVSKYLMQTDLAGKIMGNTVYLMDTFWKTPVLLYSLSILMLLAAILYVRSFQYNNKNLA